MENEFRYESINIQIKQKINDMNLITIIHREHRKDSTMFFSKIDIYNQIGYIFNNSFHLLKQYMKCINCYSNYDNDIECKYCAYKYSESKPCFFLNCRNILPFKIYKKLQKKHNLNTLYEAYYDQRYVMHIGMKEEIIARALHPNRIEKILALTNDSWMNINKYI
jgi:hypothetical protein